MADVQRNITIFTRFRTNVKQFANIMKMPLNSFRKIHDQTGRLNKTMSKNQTRMGKFAFGIRRATHGMRGFKMEMLGVMFFGMGVQKFFTGLLKPAAQLSGFMELLSTTLGLVFLPIMLALLDILLPVFTWLMNLSEGTKLWLGKLVLIGAAIGGALFLIGMFALGIGSLILAFGGLLGIVEKLFPEPLGDLAAAFLGINAAMIGGEFIVGIWNSIKNSVKGVWDKISESPVIKDLLDKLGITMDSLSTPWETLKTRIIDTFDELTEKLGIGEQVDDFKDKFDELKETFTKLWDKVKEIDFKSMADDMKDLTAELIILLPKFSELVGLALSLAGVAANVLNFLFGHAAESGRAFGAEVADAAHDFTPTDMENAMANGMETALDRAAFKNQTFVQLVTDPYNQTLRQTGGTE